MSDVRNAPPFFKANECKHSAGSNGSALALPASERVVMHHDTRHMKSKRSCIAKGSLPSADRQVWLIISYLPVMARNMVCTNLVAGGAHQ